LSIVGLQVQLAKNTAVFCVKAYLIIISSLAIWFNNLASVYFLHSCIKLLIEVPVLSSILFDTNNAMKQINRCNLMGSSLK